MIINLAWKNIWRNKVRSGVILGAIAIGLFSGTFLSAFLTGWMLGSVNDEINAELAHVQIHDSVYIANSDINAFFGKEAVSGKIAQLGIEAAVSYRLKITGMLASANNAVGIMTRGVYVEDEMNVSTVWKQIPDSLGAFLPDGDKMPIVISKRTAEKLKVKLRSKIVFTFQNESGDMQSIAFRVCGIYKTTNVSFDENNVFVRYADISPYTALPDGAVHEAAIKFDGLKTCTAVAPQLKSAFPELYVQEWNEINPGLAMSLAWTEWASFIMIAIFLFALSFGIINTMLMSVLERTHELGMLGAIGMGKRQMFGMIMMETIFLTLIGSIVGIIIGVTVIIPTLKSGIDLSFFMSDRFEDFGFGSIVYPVFNVKMFVQIVVLIIAAGILSAIYPAMKALKLKALDAIRQ